MREIWKDIRGWAGLYQVSSTGRVRSLRRRVPGKHGLCWRRGYVLKTHTTTKYAVVALSYRSQVEHRNVHDLVARAFIGPRPRRREVCHGDDNGHNNRVSNLRYDTRSNNALDRFRK